MVGRGDMTSRVNSKWNWTLSRWLTLFTHNIKYINESQTCSSENVLKWKSDIVTAKFLPINSDSFMWDFWLSSFITSTRSWSSAIMQTHLIRAKQRENGKDSVKCGILTILWLRWVSSLSVTFLLLTSCCCRLYSWYLHTRNMIASLGRFGITAVGMIVAFSPRNLWNKTISEMLTRCSRETWKVLAWVESVVWMTFTPASCLLSWNRQALTYFRRCESCCVRKNCDRFVQDRLFIGQREWMRKARKIRCQITGEVGTYIHIGACLSSTWMERGKKYHRVKSLLVELSRLSCLSRRSVLFQLFPYLPIEWLTLLLIWWGHVVVSLPTICDMSCE